jgi:hypothetical protein
MGTQVTIENALLYPDPSRTLLSYRDIRKNGLHLITHEENNDEFLHIIKKNRDDHDIVERIHSLLTGLYYTYIKLIPHICDRPPPEKVGVCPPRSYRGILDEVRMHKYTHKHIIP